MANSQTSAVATVYARSLLELATQAQTAEQTGQELKVMRDMVASDESIALFFADPVAGRSARQQVLNRAFGGRVSKLILNFLQVLNEHARLSHLVEIADAYADLLDEQLGHIEVDVTFAQRVDGQQLESVRQRIGGALKRQAVVHQYVDDAIIGGLVVRVGDQLIDASVRHQLEVMRKKLMAAAPR